MQKRLGFVSKVSWNLPPERCTTDPTWVPPLSSQPQIMLSLEGSLIEFKGGGVPPSNRRTGVPTIALRVHTTHAVGPHNEILGLWDLARVDTNII